jgi:hypothetical protein
MADRDTPSRASEAEFRGQVLEALAWLKDAVGDLRSQVAPVATYGDRLTRLEQQQQEAARQAVRNRWNWTHTLILIVTLLFDAGVVLLVRR